MQRRNFLREVRPEFWVIIAILGLFLVGLPGLFALSAEWTLFNPQAYKQELASLDFYDRFPLLIGETLADSANVLLPGAGDNLLTLIENSNMSAVVRVVLPETWVRIQAESLIDQFWAYFNFDTPRLRLLIDLRPVKENLTGEQEPQIVQTLISSLPDCTQEDLLNFALLALQGQLNQVPFCRPPEQFTNITNGVVTGILRTASSAIPDEIDFASALRMRPGGELSLAASFQTYRTFRMVGPWLPVLSFLLIGVIGFLARRTWRGAAFWCGVGLMLPGFAALLIALLLALWSSQITALLIGRLFILDLAIFEILARLLLQVFNRFLLWVGIAALISTLVGAGLAGWSLYRQRQRMVTPTARTGPLDLP